MSNVQLNPFHDQLESFVDAVGADSNNDLFQEIASSLEEQAETYQRIVDLYHKYGFGITLRHRSNEQWTLLLQDMSEPGRYRHQMFDRRGFYGHMTFNSAEDTIKDIVGQGFAVIDNGALERLSGTVEWQRGTRATDLIRAVNCGQITHAQLQAELLRP